MNLLEFIFIKVPRKAFRECFYKIEYLYYHFFYIKPKHLGVLKVPPRYFLKDETVEIAELFKKQFPDKVEGKIKEADLICEHIFDLLGSGPRKLSKEGEGYQSIDWHTDFKSGHQWDPATFFRGIRFGHKEGVDIKVPWELSRFQHLTILGQVHLLTKDEKYARELVSQVTDWIEHNPVGFGVNWSCPMDVAIRAVNWLVALKYFSENEEISQVFLQRLYSSIYEHGKFIRSYLETKPVKTNHYLSDIAGLFFISIYCPFFKESKKWQRFAVKELEKEIQHQVYPDGCNFEASTSYHRFALEVFFYCELLAKRCGIVFSAQYQQRLKKMFEFSLYCIKPNGRIPQIGDNDNGRFLIFCKRSVLEHKYLLSLAAVYYEDSEFNLPDFGFDEEAFWVFGKQGMQTFSSLPSRKKPLNSKAFADAGWYILRHKNDYCFVSCGPNGQDGMGGHAHNDKLSFELMLDGEDVIVDPGTYVYTPCPKWRNNFRSTAFHNTVKIDIFEQNDLIRGLFGLKINSVCTCTNFSEHEDVLIFEGKLNYYKKKAIHHRKLVLAKQRHRLEIHDIIKTKENNTFSINLTLAKSLNSKVLIKTKIGAFNREKNYFSPEYGIKESTFFLRNNMNCKDILENITEISNDGGNPDTK